MAAKNLNRLKLKMNTSTENSILNLVTLESFMMLEVISAEKTFYENHEIYRQT